MNMIVETPPAEQISKTEGRMHSKAELLQRYLRVRAFSKKICESLEPEESVMTFAVTP